MQKIKLLKDPGYVFDLLFIFFLNFNKKHCVENFVNNEDDAAHYDRILREFAPISDDLFVFFHALENNNCFMTYNFFYECKQDFISSYDTSYLADKLSDHDSLVKSLIQSYFSELSEQEVDECLGDSLILTRRIKNSDYSDFVKIRLYEFFAEPDVYIQKLQYEILKKDIQLERYYEKNYLQVLDIYNNLTFEKLQAQLEGIDDINFLEEDGQALFISFCLLNRICLNFVSVDEGVIYMLGSTYLNSIEYIRKNELNVKLSDFCLALSDENRVQILNFVYENGEVSCKELEREFGLSSSTAYHHLSSMMKCGVFKTRNIKKTIYYSINDKYFGTMIKLFSKYLGKKGE